MFDPFFTTKTSGKRHGSGLGLSIVQTVLAEHSGLIDYRTAEGQGTTFSVYLPLLAESAVAEERAELPSGTEQLLVVDDDPLQQTMIAEMLRMLGYQVSTAGSGEAALEIARERPPRLAILDMLLGDGIDGA